MSGWWGAATSLNMLFSLEKYRNRIRNMALIESNSVIIDFNDLFLISPDFPRALIKKPEEHLNALRLAVFEKLTIEDKEYAEKLKAQGLDVEPRIVDLPLPTPIRSPKSSMIDTLVMVEGMVTRVTPIQSLLSKAAFICAACGWRIEVIQRGQLIEGPVDCPKCRRRGSCRYPSRNRSSLTAKLLGFRSDLRSCRRVRHHAG